MPRQKHRSQLDAFNTINLTPLLDTAFMLLVVFLISAPLLENSVDVSPPEMNAEQPKVDDKSKLIALNNKGQIIFNKIVVSERDLVSQLNLISDKKTPLFLRADGSRSYKEVMGIMKIVREAGFKNISLITIAENAK